MRSIKFRAWCKYKNNKYFKQGMHYNIQNWNFEDDNDTHKELMTLKYKTGSNTVEQVIKELLVFKDKLKK